MRRSQHNPVVDMVRYQLDASIHLADAVFTGTEKIDRAMLDVTHQAVDGQLKLARAVADMRDPAKMADLQVSMAARPERAMHCQQQIMAALVEMQAEFGRSIRNYMDRMSAATAGQAEEASQQSSVGTQQAASMMPEAFTGMLSVWEQAFREASKLASENMQVARNSFESTAQTARDAASKAMHAGTVSPNGHGHGSHKVRGGRRKSG